MEDSLVMPKVPDDATGRGRLRLSYATCNVKYEYIVKGVP